MEYAITFLEGIISFISPCMLPMIPVYIGYFAGNGVKEKHPLPRVTAFVLGFSTVFCLLGLFLGTLGTILSEWRTPLNILCGIFAIFCGLGYLGIIPITFLRGITGKVSAATVLSAFLFGMVFSVSLTPCVGAFLGSALMLAASEGGTLKGFILLLVYSLGLGVPFILSALLLDKLSKTFAFIKRHYRVINIVSGVFLIAVGIAMATGYLSLILSLSI